MATSITRIRGDLTLGEKLVQIPYGLLFTVAVTASIGFAMLYSDRKSTRLNSSH